MTKTGALYRDRLRTYVRLFDPVGVMTREEIGDAHISMLEWVVEQIGGWDYRAWGRSIGYRPRH